MGSLLQTLYVPSTKCMIVETRRFNIHDQVEDIYTSIFVSGVLQLTILPNISSQNYCSQLYIVVVIIRPFPCPFPGNTRSLPTVTENNTREKVFFFLLLG